MSYDGTLNFDTSMDAEGFQDGTEKMSSIASKAFTAIAAAAAAALAVIGKVGIGYNAQMEEYTTNFTTMLGSQEAAIKKVEALKDMAAKTPFGMADLASGTQTLLAFGIANDRTMDILRQIGDVSLGNKDKFSSLTLAFAQMSSAGRLMGQDLLQMVNAGFNPLQVISEQTGESMANLKKKMENGAISTEMVADAFVIATSEGGKFYNGMEAASKTLTGQWSTLEDDAATAAGVLFQPFNEVLSSQVLPNIIALVGDLTENLSSSKMQGAMTKIAQGFSKIIQLGAELVSATLPPLITVIAGVVSAVEALVPAMGVLGASFLAFETYTFILQFYETLTALKTGVVAVTGAEAAATAGATAATWAYNAAQNAKMIALLPINAAIIIYNALTGTQIGLLGGATAAQWGLNAAMLANPIGLVVAGITLLVAGIATLILCLSRSSEAYNKQKEEIEELAKSHEEYGKQLNADQSAAEQDIAKTRGQAEANATLVGSLRTLINTNDDAGSNNKAIAQTVDQLNTAVKGLGLTYDETTGKLGASIDGVEKYVAAQGQLSVIQAQEKEYNRLLGEQLDLQAKIRVEEERKKLLATQLEYGLITQSEYNGLIARTSELLADYGETERQLSADVQAAHAAIDQSAKSSAQSQINAFEAVNGAMDAEGRNLKMLALQYSMTTDQILAEMQAQGLSLSDWSAKKAALFTKEGQSLQGVATQWGMTTDEVQSHMNDWGMSLDEFAQHMEDTHTKEGLSLADLAAKWGTTTAAIKLEMDNMGISMQEWSNQQQAAWTEYENAAKAHAEGVVNSFKEIPSEYDKSAQEMLEILINNKMLYTEWEVAMEEITRLLGPTAAAEFAKLGPEATSAMQEILGSSDLLDEYREIFGVKIDETTGLAVENWNDPNFIGAPSKAVAASAQQVTQNDALNKAMKYTLEGAKSAAEAMDFSVVGQNIAADIVGGLNSADVSGAMESIAAAIFNNTGRVISAVTGMSASVQNVLRNMKTQAVTIATQMMSDINNAIVASSNTVRSSATSMMNGTAADIVGGLNSAIVSRANTVRSSATSMGGGVITSLNTMKTQAANVTAQMMNDIAAAVSNNTGRVTSAVTSMSTSVQTVLRNMKTQAANVTAQMMTEINNAIVSRANTVRSSATSMGGGVITSLNTMKTQAANVTAQMMNDIAAAISNNTGRVTSAVTSMDTSVQTVLRNMKTQATTIATQMMTEINSAIVSRSNTVRSSVNSMGNGVIAALDTMKKQAANVTAQMMDDINNAIVASANTVRASATAAADGVVSGFRPMVSGAENAASNMMDGIRRVLEQKAPGLYAKAREIADVIARIMAEELDVHSPSRVMIRLFENVMLGIYEGMDGMSGMLYREAESIADGIADRLTISPDVADALVGRMSAVTECTPLGGSTLVTQLAGAGSVGSTHYVTNLTQNITTPKPLSPSEMTREGQDLLRRQRWQLP